MAAIISLKIKASSILETLVALTILLVIFGIVTTVFVQVSLNSGSEKQFKVEQLLNEFAKSTKDERSYFDDEVKKDDFLLQRKVEKYYDNPVVVHIHFLIYDANNKLLQDWNELAINDKD